MIVKQTNKLIAFVWTDNVLNVEFNNKFLSHFLDEVTETFKVNEFFNLFN